MPPIEFKTGVIRPIECFKEGWELIKDQYWLFMGISVVGMFFTLPLMYAGIFVAYRKVFPPNKAAGFNEPPPPYSFQDAGRAL